MKRFLFLSLFLLSFSLFAQVSFQSETRTFTQLGLTTNEQIANYLQIELSDLLPISQYISAGDQLASISPADFYNLILSVFQDDDIVSLLRISKELGVTFDRFMLAFNKEMSFVSEEDLQMMLAMYRIGVKWSIIAP